MEARLQDGRAEESAVTGPEICALDDLDDPGARGFTLDEGKSRRDIFLVRKEGAVFAYLNRCPHANQKLDARPGRFLTQDETQIICGGHAALFRIEDGLCTSGPCAGQRLEPIVVEVADGVVRLAG
ncbi:MAG: Rieske (2Fe-2S) protein [Parvibaculaceae bacterium]|nr:Rieske (2Fe-2S) protein [Parvibaculaceae bacterium]